MLLKEKKEKKRKISNLVNLFFLVMISLLFLKIMIAQPQAKTVRGTVFKSDGVTQVESGLNVFINDTNTSVFTYTITYGPTPQPGLYSATLNSSLGDIIYVRAWNATNWGEHSGIMAQTHVVIDVLLNRTRNSEAKVIILNPANHTSYSSPTAFNVTANITILGNNGVNCNATISFSVDGIFQLGSGETYTHSLGNIQRGNSVITFWNLTAYGDGMTNITVNSRCGSDGYNLENLNIFTIYNLSSLDISPPLVTLILPHNNSRVNNPFVFYYNVSDGTPIINCALSINNISVNITANPTRNILLNFTRNLDERANQWEINCTDSSIMQNLGTSGLFNLTLNYFPSISNIIVNNPVNLIAGSTKIVYCNGTATDGDTYNDIRGVNASLFYYQKQPNSPNNLSNHYTNSSCSLFNAIGNDVDFICSFNLEYYANNGTWYCNATILDMINSTNTSQLSITINDLLAIGITPGVIDFGGLEILQISPSDIVVNVTNYGNIMLDLNLYGYALFENDNLSMDCTKGNITMEYERFSIIQGQNFDLMNSINNTINAPFVNFNLPKREGGSAIESRKAVYWKLQIPMRTGGRCNGKVVFTALRG